MAVPVPRTWVAAELVNASIGNQHWRDVFNFMLAPPRALAYRGSTLAVSAGVWSAAIGMANELYDLYSPAAHDNATNNSRVIAQEAGIYSIFCQLRFAGVGGAGGVRGLDLRKNAAGSQASGTRIAFEHRDVTGGGEATVFGLQVDASLNSGDYVEFFAFNGDSVSRNVDGTFDSTFLGLRWVATQ